MWVDILLLAEGTPPRHIYSITDVGRELLHDMPAELPEDTVDNAREFMARLVHFDWLTPEEQLRILDARDNALAGDRERTAVLASARAEHWSRLPLEHGIDRIDWERAWLADIRAEVEAVPASRNRRSPGPHPAAGGAGGQKRSYRGTRRLRGIPSRRGQGAPKSAPSLRSRVDQALSSRK
ncbi:hypothetical protein ABZ464_13605 [Streptomyces sp. NPDC005820]|uniref:hypothetical protein n=1 Tax=Streptomyces sp. NPDC005820 TaxID=3157069 RepID=UPI0033D3BA7E